MSYTLLLFTAYAIVRTVPSANRPKPKHVPSDAEAVLEWGLDIPFSSQDKPPLAMAMVVIVNGVRSLKRFRLVIAQKSKLRLIQEVTAALAS